MSGSIRGAFVAAFLLALRVGVDAQATVATPRTPGEPMFTVSEEEDQAQTSLVCQSYTQDGSATFQNGKARSDIVVRDHYRVDDVRVSGITMKHPRVGALRVALRGVSLGPRGLDSLHETSVTLVNRKGKRGQDYLFTGFSDQASSSFPDARDAAPYTGMWTPAQPLRMLTRGPGVKAGNGGSSGVWSLLAEDRLGLPEEDVEGAEISSWTLQLCYNKVEETLRQEAQEEAFAHFDVDNDGHLSMEEYQAALDELKHLNLPEEDLIDMFGELDRNSNDLVSLEDFLQHHSEEDINKLKESLGFGETNEGNVFDEEREISICSEFPNLELCAPARIGASRDESNGSPSPGADVEASTMQLEQGQDNGLVQGKEAPTVLHVLSTPEDPSTNNQPHSLLCRFASFLPQCPGLRDDALLKENSSPAVPLQDVDFLESQQTRPTVCKLFPESNACFYALGTIVGAPLSEQWTDDLFDQQEEEDFLFAAPSAVFEPPVALPPPADLEPPSSEPPAEPPSLKKSRDGRPALYDVLDFIARTSSPVGLLASKWASIRSQLDLTEEQLRRFRLATAAAVVGWSKMLARSMERRKEQYATGAPLPFWGSDGAEERFFIGPAKCACHLGYPKNIECLLFDWQCRPMEESTEHVEKMEYSDGYGVD